MRSLLTNRNACIYIVGQVFSLFGDLMLVIAVGVWVKELTGSTAAAGLTYFFVLAPDLFAPLAGLLVDRRRRRVLLMVTNVALAALTLSMLFVRDAGDIWIIYTAMALSGFVSLVIPPGQAALLVSILPAELLGEANSVLSFVRNGLRLLAPVAGAGLFAVFGAEVILIIDAATFLVAALSLALMRVREDVDRREQASWLKDVTAGFSYVRGVVSIQQLTVASVLGWSTIGLAEVIVFAVIDALGRPAAFLGVLVSLQGVGALMGAAVAAPVMRRTGEAGLVATGLMIGGLAAAMQVLSQEAVVLSAMLLTGVGITWVGIGANTLVQRRTPTGLLGRVDAAVTMAVSLPQTIFIAAGAALVAVVDYRILLGAMTVAMAGSGVWLVTRRATRDYRVPVSDVDSAGSSGHTQA